MDKKVERKIYFMAQIICTIIICIAFSFIYVLGTGAKIVVPIYTFILAGFPASLISKLFIKWGDKIQNKALKILYYALALPCLLAIIVIDICYIINLITLPYAKPDKYGSYMGASFTLLFLWVLTIIAFLLPYLKTLIVLLLRRINQKRGQSFLNA